MCDFVGISSAGSCLCAVTAASLLCAMSVPSALQAALFTRVRRETALLEQCRFLPPRGALTHTPLPPPLQNRFYFSDLLDVPALAEHPLLQLFCFGTLADYVASPAVYGTLDPHSLNKLKMLSLVSLAAAARELPYAALQAQLQLTSPTDVETLVTQCINAGLVTVRWFARP